MLTLTKPHTFAVDLSKVPVGTQFHLHIEAVASAFNRFAGPPSELPTAAGAYMNFEDAAGGAGSMFTSTGLEEVETPTDLPPPPAVIHPGVLRARHGPGRNAAVHPVVVHDAGNRWAADGEGDTHWRHQRRRVGSLRDERRLGHRRNGL